MFDYVRLPTPIERLVFDWVRLNFIIIVMNSIKVSCLIAQAQCHFRGTCGSSESLEQIPIESCRVLHLLSAAPAALHSLETCPSSGMPQMSCPK